jgi:hypothetical protein
MRSTAAACSWKSVSSLRPRVAIELVKESFDSEAMRRGRGGLPAADAAAFEDDVGGLDVPPQRRGATCVIPSVSASPPAAPVNRRLGTWWHGPGFGIGESPCAATASLLDGML